jgi:hypothetical protein
MLLRELYQQATFIYDPCYVVPVVVYLIREAQVEDKLGYWEGKHYREAG